MKNRGTASIAQLERKRAGVRRVTKFIAATSFDRKFRAFDNANGKLLWETTLPFAGNATPATYQVGGRQFVVVHATGEKARRGEPSGGVYLAFALPRGDA